MNEIKRQNAELEAVTQLLSVLRDVEADEDEDEDEGDNVAQILRLIEWLEMNGHSAEDILKSIKYVFSA